MSLEKLLTISGVSKVFIADNAAYEYQLAENIAELVIELGKDYNHILSAATTTGKNFMPRVAALLDVAQISDIIAVISAGHHLPALFMQEMLLRRCNPLILLKSSPFELRHLIALAKGIMLLLKLLSLLQYRIILNLYLQN